MDWTNENVITFLELYRELPIIWNPKHPEHKNKKKLLLAWLSISEKMGIPVNELKVKKNSLMASFRAKRRKKLASLTTSTEGEDIYEPVWFAYRIMEEFLSPESGLTLKFDEVRAVGDDEEHLYEIEVLEEEDDNVIKDPPSGDEYIEEVVVNNECLTPVSQNGQLFRISTEVNESQKVVNKTIKTVKKNKDKVPPNDDDDCALYGKLLATKLRSYSNFDRHLLMHKIDGLLLTHPPGSV